MVTSWRQKHFPFWENIITNSYIRINGPLPFIKQFQTLDFVSKEFHSYEHEQATLISVAAGGVYYQEHHQEDDHDDANHGAFSHTATAHFEGEMGGSRFAF